MTKRTIGRCALCLRDEKELQRSHAIPNAIFRPILSSNNGSGVSISLDPNLINRLSGDSWKEPQLCRCCESTINKEYEQKAIEVIRRENNRARYCQDGLSISGIDFGAFRSFFVSIFWRASVWKHSAFSGFQLPTDLSERIRNNLSAGRAIPSSEVGVRLWTLKDEHFGHQDDEPFQQIIMSPFFSDKSASEMLCVFGGFFVSAVIGGFGFKNSREQGVLRDGARAVIAPWKNPASVPKLLELGMLCTNAVSAGDSCG
jgi:hypothetical protein